MLRPTYIQFLYSQVLIFAVFACVYGILSVDGSPVGPEVGTGVADFQSVPGSEGDVSPGDNSDLDAEASHWRYSSYYKPRWSGYGGWGWGGRVGYGWGGGGWGGGGWGGRGHGWNSNYWY
ncbi:heterogeneous nuclear ribonucleoprotein 87F-like isoform X1 [Neodiprion fabricii]|uniref:heterogeneous nuclear ribonucleoprotein 87F-like isoform X1 n=1 Tax=Neodiprion fabricii TaxID=2872261 RepID=UPI001ED91230|nr:heterogeneous nuclear ribonucleoprotein 87F-like isoform X1 [Neodiprion fabricii]